MHPLDKEHEVRGLLCYRCNTALGGIERNKNPREFLQAIIRYFSFYRMRNDPQEGWRPYDPGPRGIK